MLSNDQYAKLSRVEELRMRDQLLANLEHALQAHNQHVADAVMQQIDGWKHAAPQSLRAAADMIVKRYLQPEQPVAITEAHEGGKAFVPQDHGKLGD